MAVHNTGMALASSATAGGGHGSVRQPALPLVGITDVWQGVGLLETVPFEISRIIKYHGCLPFESRASLKRTVCRCDIHLADQVVLLSSCRWCICFGVGRVAAPSASFFAAKERIALLVTYFVLEIIFCFLFENVSNLNAASLETFCCSMKRCAFEFCAERLLETISDFDFMVAGIWPFGFDLVSQDFVYYQSIRAIKFIQF